MLNLLKKFFNKEQKPEEKKTYTPSEDSGFKPTFVYPDADYVHEALGITEERRIEMAKIYEAAMNDNSDNKPLPYRLEKVIPHMKHPNELFFLGMMLGTWHERNVRKQDIIEKMKGFLGGGHD